HRRHQHLARQRAALGQSFLRQPKHQEMQNPKISTLAPSLALFFVCLVIMGCNQMNNELSHDEEVAEFVSRLYSEVGMPRTENALLDYLNQRGIEYAVIDKGNQFMFEIEVQRSKALD